MTNNLNALRSVLLTGLICSGATSAAAPKLFPNGCEVKGFGFSQNYLVLNDNGSQAFYLIQNHGDKAIELERYETREVFMSPSLRSKIDSAKWSAFASDIENQHFQCLLPQPDDQPALQVDCREYIDVCQYPRVKFALSNMGNYWVSTNKSQSEVINEAVKKGIYLHW